MPRREGGYRRMEDLTLRERLQNDGIFQAHWYQLVAPWCAEKSVLDVGAGSGYGMGILRVHGAAEVFGVDPLPLRADVSCLPVDKIRDGAFDVVVAMDVVEHVEGDASFLRQLLRVAREWVFLSTPNWRVSGAKNEFHVREYAWEDLLELIGDRARAASYYSSDDACRVRPIATLKEAEACFGVRLWKEPD